MRIPIQSMPLGNQLSRRVNNKMNTSGHNKQCCGDDCIEKYCLIGASSKGCDSSGRPYIHCIG
ncbi:hypothetical protein [Aquimarina aquimarini]|uniref:hypothetical protein n=1 Tax=Aquimarina aquimarini TaxID=1191734 RepID=UPI001F196DC2|nr:hypothetical protein [Aquimarina aquimarini]